MLGLLNHFLPWRIDGAAVGARGRRTATRKDFFCFVFLEWMIKSVTFFMCVYAAMGEMR